MSRTIVGSAIVSSAIVSREPRLAARRHDAVRVVFGDHELRVHAERGGAGAGAVLLQRPRLRVLEPHLGVAGRGAGRGAGKVAGKVEVGVVGARRRPRCAAADRAPASCRRRASGRGDNQ
eukprot:scaffold12852_cov57-Phaeocystis_antarctica.AAC.1